MKILVVEDERDIGTLLSLVLAEGNDITLAHSGLAGVALATNNDWDCIVTDLMMPEASGVDVIKAAKARNPDAKVILHTAVDLASAGIALEGLSGVLIVPKGVSSRTLIQQVEL